MPRKSGKQTPQERVFIDAYVARGDAKAAAEAAGYKLPGIAGNNVLARPAIQAEIVRLQQERIANELLPLAVDVHKALLTGANVPAGAKVQAVKLAYDRAFGPDDAARDKEPHEMSAEELAEAIDKLKRVASERAQPVIDGQAREIPDSEPESGVFE